MAYGADGMNLISEQEIVNSKPATEEHRIKHVRELINLILGQYLSNPKKIYGFPTQLWPIFNSAFGGLRPGELITITGDTGIGKSTLAMNLLMDSVQQGRTGFVM